MQFATHRSFLCMFCMVAALALIGGCASHRAPPLCKGPYTPINQPLAVASHDAQP